MRELSVAAPETTTTPTAGESNSRGLEVRAVVKTFAGHPVLNGVTLTVPPGSTTAVVGPSGSGKTTLLRVIAGFEQCDSGTVSLGGQLLASTDRSVAAHRRNIGFVTQDGALFPHLSIGANIMFGLDRRRGQDRRARLAQVTALLETVSLDPEMVDRRPHQLSGGQQQRVALARALARHPHLMLLDESFSALDAGLRAETRRAVSGILQRAGVTTVLVTHDQGEALSFADQVAVIRDGRLAQVGEPATVYSQPVDRATADFLGEATFLQGHVIGDRARCALGDVTVRAGSVQGEAMLMFRPEQIDLDTRHGIPVSLVGTEYFGPHSRVRVRLHGGGPQITVLHPGVVPSDGPLHVVVNGLPAVMPRTSA
jgi:iron(III) transport system ATP-binding protein